MTEYSPTQHAMIAISYKGLSDKTPAIFVQCGQCEGQPPADPDNPCDDCDGMGGWTLKGEQLAAEQRAIEERRDGEAAADRQAIREWADRNDPFEPPPLTPDTYGEWQAWHAQNQGERND